MARRVLVPLDGSPAAETAVWHAAAVMQTLAEGLLLLQVLEPPPDDGTAGGEVDWRLRRAEAEAYLRSIAERLDERGIDAVTAVAMGAAADEIVRYARRDDVELIVLAAHGRGEARAFDFGGTSHKVLSQAPSSIMVVRRADGSPPAEAPAAAPWPDVRYRQVLVPLDGSPTCEWALSLAAAVAREHGATLLMLHLVPEAVPAYDRLPRSPEEADLQQRLVELQKQRGARYLAEMDDKLAHMGITVRTRLGQAVQVADEIQVVAAEEGVDLVALSAHGSSAAPFPYGGVTQRLLATSALPVLVFQDVPVSADQASRRSAERASTPPPGREPADDGP